MYSFHMIDLKFEEPATDEVEVDDETLAAIDKGLEDVEAGRTVPLDEVRKKIPRWISKSDSRNRP